MNTFILIVCVINAVAAFSKLSASFTSFALATDRGKMPEDIRDLTVKSDIMHGFNDLSHSSFFASFAVFCLSKLTTFYSPYEWIFKVALALLLVAAFLTVIFINRRGINNKIAEMREKWSKQKRFTEDHDHEVNYVHIMEATRDDLPQCIIEAVLMGLVVFLL